MPDQAAMSTRSLKPLYGFGWPGRCLLALALTIAALMFAGVDLRLWIMSRVHYNLGWDATVWFVTGFLHSHAMFDFIFLPPGGWSFSHPPDMRFSLITMCLTLIALHVHPARLGLFRLLGLICIGVIIPGLTMDCFRWLPRLCSIPIPRSQAVSISAFAAFLALSAAATILALRWVTRSPRITALAAAFLVLGAWLSAERYAASDPSYEPFLFRVFGNETWFHWLGWSWNPLFFAVLLTWAIRARPKIFPSHACQSCGYDLRGTPSDQCPECGRHAPQPATSVIGA